MEFENCDKMFLSSLNLNHDWKVIKTKFEDKEVHVHIEKVNDKEGGCPICGIISPKYDFEDQIKAWRHGDCVFFPTYIHCRRMRVKCQECGVHTISVPWARDNSKFTLQFEGYALFIAINMPLSKACKLMRCGYKQLFNIIKYWIDKSISERSLKHIIAINVDETSSKKGHNYVTIIIDSIRRDVINVQEGKDNTTMIRFKDFLIAHGGDPDNIKRFTSDLSSAYKKGCEENFPNAQRNNDKFHVKQLLVKAIGQIRLSELKKEKDKVAKAILKKTNRTITMRKENLTDRQNEYVNLVNKNYKKIGKAYQMIECLDDFYNCSSKELGEAKLNKLLSWMSRCRIDELKKVGKTYKDNKETILNYFENRETNAISEGINSSIQSLKRRARGYSNIENFIMMIYLIGGGFELDSMMPY